MSLDIFSVSSFLDLIFEELERRSSDKCWNLDISQEVVKVFQILRISNDDIFEKFLQHLKARLARFRSFLVQRLIIEFIFSSRHRRFKASIVENGREEFSQHAQFGLKIGFCVKPGCKWAIGRRVGRLLFISRNSA